MSQDNLQKVIMCGMGPNGLVPVLVDATGKIVTTSYSWKIYDPDYVVNGAVRTFNTNMAGYAKLYDCMFFALNLSFIADTPIFSVSFSAPDPGCGGSPDPVGSYSGVYQVGINTPVKWHDTLMDVGGSPEYILLNNVQTIPAGATATFHIAGYYNISP
jgi:hypothetical protein